MPIFTDVVTDDFTRANGAVANGSAKAGAGSAAISGDLLEIATSGSAIVDTILTYSAAASRDQEVVTVIKGSGSGSTGSALAEVLFRSNGLTGSSATAYVAWVNSTPGNTRVDIFSLLNGGFVGGFIANVNFAGTYVPTDDYTLTASCYGINPTLFDINLTSITTGTTLISVTGLSEATSTNTSTTGVAGVGIGNGAGTVFFGPLTIATGAFGGSILTPTGSTTTANSLAWTATPTATQYQLYGSTDPTFSPGSGNLLYTGTGLAYTHTPSGSGTGTVWYYTLVASNGTSTYTAFSVPCVLKKGAFTFGLLGDSITRYMNLAQQLISELGILCPDYLFNLCLDDGTPPGENGTPSNQGVPGTTTFDWLPTSTNIQYTLNGTGYNAFLNALRWYQLAGVTTVIGMLGANDCHTSGGQTTASQYQANLIAITQAYQAHGITVVWCNPTCPVIGTGPTSGAGGGPSYTTASIALCFQYAAEIDAVCAACGTPRGDKYATDFFANNPELLGDGLHPTSSSDPTARGTGQDLLQRMHAPSLLNALGLLGAAAGSAPSATGLTLQLGAAAGYTGQVIGYTLTLSGGTALAATLNYSITGLPGGTQTGTIASGTIQTTGSFTVGSPGNLTATLTITGGNAGMSLAGSPATFTAQALPSGGTTATAYTVVGIPANPVVGETYPVNAILNDPASAGGVITPTAHSGITWGGAMAVASGSVSSATTVTFTAAGSYTPAFTHSGLGFSGDPTASAVTAAAGGGPTATGYTVAGIPAAPMVGEAYPVVVTLNDPAGAAGIVTFGAATGITWGGTVAIAGGAVSGSTTVTFTSPGTYTPTATHTGLGFAGDYSFGSYPASAPTGGVTLQQLNSALATALGTIPVSINLGQTGLSPRALDNVADNALTVGDGLVAAIAGAAGKEAVVGTAYTVKTPAATTIRNFTLDSATTPTSRS